MLAPPSSYPNFPLNFEVPELVNVIVKEEFSIIAEARPPTFISLFVPFNPPNDNEIDCPLAGP